MVLQKPFLQPRQRPVDFQRPRNLFVDCSTYTAQHPIDYRVFIGIFNRTGRANKIDPNPPRPRNRGRNKGYRKPINAHRNAKMPFSPESNMHGGRIRSGICTDNCLDRGKSPWICKRVCRCRSKCLSNGHSLVTCLRRCRKRH